MTASTAWTAPVIGIGPLFVAGLVGVATAIVLGLVGGAHSARVRGRGRSSGPAVPAWFAAALDYLELRAAPVAIWPWAQAAAIVAVAIVAWRWPVAAVVATVVGLAAWRAAPRRHGDDDIAVRNALPEALDFLVATMASGASLGQAVAAAGERSDPAGRDLAEVARAHRTGLSLHDALDSWAARRTDAGVPLVVDALALAGRTGGSQAAALRSVGDTLREREALAREVRALGSQAQLSAWVLVAVPLGFAAVVALLDRRIAVFLVATVAGWACLIVGIALDVAGAWWMRRLLRRFA